MKKFLSFAFIVIFAHSAFGASLIYKNVKEVSSNEETVIATFNTASLKQIRVGVYFTNPTNAIAERELKTLQKLFDDGNIEEKLYISSRNAELAKMLIPNLDFYWLEDAQEVFLQKGSYNTLIDTPPSTLILKGKGKGTYKVYVWGQ